ncbi:hypothetical protein FN846DRAFT_604815 [Sphaerosporella brunnea]|uniref:Uncharacterized protein n=1 Tax=Sphaerosporella brunnea TaxID=1250544 RepID=A0A5J5F1M8_9PEZI|nr:hypothetical protein FN846DRAFT_604815 [Sphaerosporella brunnea]
MCCVSERSMGRVDSDDHGLPEDSIEQSATAAETAATTALIHIGSDRLSRRPTEKKKKPRSSCCCHRTARDDSKQRSNRNKRINVTAAHGSSNVTLTIKHGCSAASVLFISFRCFECEAALALPFPCIVPSAGFPLSPQSRLRPSPSPTAQTSCPPAAWNRERAGPYTGKKKTKKKKSSPRPDRSPFLHLSGRQFFTSLPCARPRWLASANPFPGSAKVLALPVAIRRDLLLPYYHRHHHTPHPP